MTTIVFDVNETLLDLSALDLYFERIFGTNAIKREWFQQVLQTALTTTILGRSRELDFGQVGRIALDMTAQRHGITLSDEVTQGILGGMLTLPPYADVPEAIQRLHTAGLRLAALTNSAQRAAEMQLSNAGLSQYMSRILSVEAVGKFKPALEVYQMAAQQLDEAPGDLWLVAAHDWDIAGALNAGWRGAFVARVGKVFHPDEPQPEIIERDLNAIADALLGRV